MQKYKIIKTMGDGSFGVVFKAVTPKNQIVAIKKFKQKYSTWDQCLDLRQIKSLKKLDHPNIIKLKQVILANNQLYLVFDFIQTNLYQMYVRASESKRTLTEGEIKSIFYQITNALAYLHKNGFFHRDLKPQNILCFNNQVKICDFGLARQIRSKPPFTEYVSTRWYRAPELLLHSGTYNYPVDIFALACIIIELYTMQPLFPGTNEVETLNKIVELLGTPKKEQWPEGYKLASKCNYNFPQKKKKELYNIMPDADPEILDLLESMLSYSSKKRPTASQILKHEYFSSLKPNQNISDPKNQTKFSFYEKQIIQIPKNIKVQNPKQMQMRRSMIKFGNSFTSSFHLSKEQKKQKQKQKIDEIISSNKKIINNQKDTIHSYGNNGQNSNNKKFTFKTSEDQITKKFDQMQQILMQLQVKQKSAKKQQKKQKRKSQQPFKQQNYDDLMKQMSGTASFKKQPSNNNLNKNTSEQVKLTGFIFGGLNGIASNNNLKNLIKYPNGTNSKY